jgi:hypothetical protein
MIQNWIHRIEEGGGLRYLKYGLIALFGAGLLVGYNLRGFKNMSNAEAMDAAQLARNIATHRGYNTLFVRPLSLYLVEKADAEKNGPPPVGDTRDRSRIRGMHPDLANPPVYPLALACLMKADPKFRSQIAGSAKLWNRGGSFAMYEPDFLIGLFNQALFFVSVVAVFFLARRFFDSEVAWTSAGVFLGTDLFWRFSISGLSTMLLILIFIGLSWCLVALEKSAREGQGNPLFLIALAAAVGVIIGIGCLTRYSFGWLIIPVLLFLILFLGRHRVILALTVMAAFAVVVGPWCLRNYRISHTAFGVASYAIYETTTYFPEHQMERSLNPDLTRIRYTQVWFKFINNAQACLQEDLPKLGGSWVSAFFLVGLLVPYKNPSLRRLRYFVLFCLPVLLVAQALGKTALSEDNPVINSENLLVIVAPIIVVFGMSLFYVLLDQMQLPAREFRYLIIGVFCLLICAPALINFVQPRTNAVAYPPYYPPVIQKISGWMRENELMMSDIPWAVAWYGDRQCIWLTLNAQKDFFDVYDYRKPVKAVYMTPVTMDRRFLSQWVRADELSWGSFALEGMMKHEIPPYFPLHRAPSGFLPEQLFITDVDRWSQPGAASSIPSQ